MKTKKLLSALCAAAVLLSSLAGGIVFTSYRSAHAEDLIPAPYVTGESADGENVVDNPEESETTENTVETISNRITRIYRTTGTNHSTKLQIR